MQFTSTIKRNSLYDVCVEGNLEFPSKLIELAIASLELAATSLELAATSKLGLRASMQQRVPAAARMMLAAAIVVLATARVDFVAVRRLEQWKIKCD